MTSRLLLTLWAIAGGLTAQEPEAPPQPWRDLRTPDGSRFLLVQSSDLPVIHWVTAIPAGDLVDPPEYPGLSFAVVHASTAGTDTVGTSDWREERRAVAERRRIAARIRDLELRGEDVPEDLQKALDRTDRELAKLVDAGAWERAVQAAPALDVTIVELPELVLLGVTTEPDGFATVARLLMDRRENAALRTIDECYARVTKKRRAAAVGPDARLRAELRDLAFFGLGPRPPQESTEVDPNVALELYRRTHSPTATLNVITGGFDIDQMALFLERQFAVSSLPAVTVSGPMARRSSRERLSTITGGTRDAVAIGIELDETVDSNDLRILAEWFAGGDNSFVAQQLRASGILGAEVRYEAPYPMDAKPGLLLVEVYGPRAASAEQRRKLLPAIRTAIRQSPTRAMTWADLRRARDRTVQRLDVDLASPADLARWLAIECGVRGRTLDDALAKPAWNIDRDKLRELAGVALVGTNRCIVQMEARK